MHRVREYLYCPTLPPPLLMQSAGEDGDLTPGYQEVSAHQEYTFGPHLQHLLHDGRTEGGTGEEKTTEPANTRYHRN